MLEFSTEQKMVTPLQVIAAWGVGKQSLFHSQTADLPHVLTGRMVNLLSPRTP